MTKKNKSIGSYFGLELPFGNDFFHNSGLRINSGRNAFEYILKVKNVKSIYLPYYSCESLYTPLKRLNLDFKFYHVNNRFEPEFDSITLRDSDYFLYINYFGLCSDIIVSLAKKVSNLIVDNTQAFFCKPLNNIPTFYSARKFFGVSDGAYLFNIESNINLEQDFSASRMSYLLYRIENEPEIAYKEYKKVEEELDNVPLKRMSLITEQILSAIPYQRYMEIRNEHFNKIHTAFNKINKLKILSFHAPMIYPLWIKSGKEIKKKIIEKRIFLATYWPNVLTNPELNKLEKSFVEDIIPIPIDQRYDVNEIQYIIDTIEPLIK